MSEWIGGRGPNPDSWRPLVVAALTALDIELAETSAGADVPTGLLAGQYCLKMPNAISW